MNGAIGDNARLQRFKHARARGSYSSRSRCSPRHRCHCYRGLKFSLRALAYRPMPASRRCWQRSARFLPGIVLNLLLPLEGADHVIFIEVTGSLSLGYEPLYQLPIAVREDLLRQVMKVAEEPKQP